MNINYHTLILKKNEILEELKNEKYKDLEDVVFRFQLTSEENIDILDLEHIQTKTTGYSITPGISEITDINLMLKHLLPNKVKIFITINDIRLESILYISRTLIFTRTSFFYRILGFTQSHSGVLGEIKRFFSIDSRFL